MTKVEQAKGVLFWFENNRYRSNKDKCPYEMSIEEARKIEKKELYQETGRSQYLI